MRAAVVALASLVACVVGAPSFSSPVIVDTLAKPAKGNQPEVKNAHPLPYPNNDDHAWVSQMRSLQHEIEQHDATLESLNKDMEKAKEHKAKLHAAQKLMHALVSLHQSESVLHIIDSRMEGLKASVKKVGDQAEEAMRAREELKKQMEDSLTSGTDKLQELRKKLAAKSASLDALCSKRDEVAGIVSEWRAHVDGLRAAGGLPPRNGGDSLSIPVLPRPPSQETEEEKEEEEAAAGKGGKDAAGSDEEEEPRKAPQEKVEGDTVATTVAEDVTATKAELEATRASLDHVVNVHIPSLTGATKVVAANAKSFLEAAERTYADRV